MEVDKALDIDQSLDTFVQEEKARRNKQRRKQRSSLTNKNRRPGAPSGPGPVRSAATATTKPKKDLFPEQVGEGKIVVSNLPSDVTQSQVEDLFKQSIGPVKSCSLAFNDKGRSTGIATVVFRNYIHARNAYNQFNGRVIDENRLIKVEVLYDPARAPPPSLSERLAPAPKPKATDSKTTAAKANGAKTTRVPRGPRAGRRTTRDEPPSQAKLDAEMDEYVSQQATAA